MMTKILNTILIISTLNSFAQKSKYDKITKIDNNFSFVQKNGKYGIIDNSGKIIFPVKYSQILTCDIDNSQKTYFKVNSEDKWGFIELANAKTISS